MKAPRLAHNGPSRFTSLSGGRLGHLPIFSRPLPAHLTDFAYALPSLYIAHDIGRSGHLHFVFASLSIHKAFVLVTVAQFF